MVDPGNGSLPPASLTAGERRGFQSAGAPPAEPSGGWVLGRALRTALRRFRASWAALPRRTRERWAWIVTAGLGAGLLLASAATLLARHLAPRGLQAWDEAMLLRIVEGSPVSFSTAIWAETPGNGVFMIPLVLVAAAVAAWRRMPLHALTLLAAYVLLDLQVGAGWLLWDRARPSLVVDGQASPGLHAFPSGHVAQAVSFYGILVYLWVRASGSAAERGLAVLAFAAVVATVALSRLRLGAHWPSDVLAGALIGGAWLAVLAGALRWAAARGGR
jgi:membrane-associated phospholipid phosphatase